MQVDLHFGTSGRDAATAGGAARRAGGGPDGRRGTFCPPEKKLSTPCSTQRRPQTPSRNQKRSPTPGRPPRRRRSRRSCGWAPPVSRRSGHWPGVSRDELVLSEECQGPGETWKLKLFSFLLEHIQAGSDLGLTDGEDGHVARLNSHLPDFPNFSDGMDTEHWIQHGEATWMNRVPIEMENGSTSSSATKPTKDHLLPTCQHWTAAGPDPPQSSVGTRTARLDVQLHRWTASGGPKKTTNAARVFTTGPDPKKITIKPLAHDPLFVAVLSNSKGLLLSRLPPKKGLGLHIGATTSCCGHEARKSTSVIQPRNTLVLPSLGWADLGLHGAPLVAR